MKNYLIIGNGIAAAGCIEGIRSVDSSSAVKVISSERHPIYCRPLISYCLSGKTDLSRIWYRDQDFYESNGCRILYGKNAVSIDLQGKSVLLDDGGRAKFDALCIAAGSKPVVPRVEGLESVGKKFFFITIDDMSALEEAVSQETRVLIIGAGMIGLKCAEGLRGRAGSITVCDLAGHILPSVLDADCAALLQKRLEDNGITLLLKDSAARFEGKSAFMVSGERLEFDVLVLAVGIRPNTELMKDMDNCVNKGIVTDTHMRTRAPGIYAAGDCTESFDVSCRQMRMLANLPNAYMEGHCAGVNMAGGDEEFSNSIPMNSIGFFGLHAMTAGSCFTREHGGKMYEERGDGSIKRLYTKDGYLTGFMMVGDIDRAGIYTSIIRDRVPLADIDFEMIKKSPALMPLGQEYRGKKLGGVV